MGLDVVELVMAYEEEFDIRIPDAEAEKLITPRLTCDLIENTLAYENRHIPRGVIDEKVRGITLEQLGIEESIYHPDAEYVRDFGID